MAINVRTVGPTQDVAGQLQLPIEEIATKVRADGITPEAEAAPAAPEIPQESTPLTQSLEAQGLIEPIAQAATRLPEGQDTRQPSLSEASPDIAHNVPQLGFDFNGEGAFVTRANNIRGMLDQTGDQRLALKFVGDEYAKFTEEGVDALRSDVKKVIFGPALDAGIPQTVVGFDGQPKQTLSVDPALADVMTGVVDRLFAGESVGEARFSHVESDAAPEGDTFNPDADPIAASTRASNNIAAGREIVDHYHREKAARDGLSEQEFLRTRPTATDQELALIGGMAKMLYARANPNLIQETPGSETESGQSEYNLTTEGELQLKKWMTNNYAPFQTQEVKPNKAPVTPRTPQSDRPLGRKKTGKLDSEKQKLSEAARESNTNQQAMPKIVDTTRESLSYGIAINGLKEIAGYDQQFDSPEALEVAVTEGTAPPTPLADMFEIGTDRLKKIYGRRNKLKFQYEQAKNNPNADEATVRMAEKEYLDYNAVELWKKEQLKVIEALRSIAENRGQANYLDYAYQLGTTRQHVMQTIFNPGANKAVRFAIGDGQMARINPGEGGQVTNNWKEVVATKLLADPIGREHPFVRQLQAQGLKVSGKYLTPKARIEYFQAMERSGALAEFGAIGAILKKALPSRAQTDSTAELLKSIPANQPTLPGGLQETTPFTANLTEAERAKVMEFMGRHNDLEGLYALEAAMEVDSYLQGEPFHSRIEAEMDGITNGPSNLGLLLGSRDIAFRSGLITANPLFKLMPDGTTESDIEAATEEELQVLTQQALDKAQVQGDIRDVIYNFLDTSGGNIVGEFVDAAGKTFSEKEQEGMLALVNIAKENKDLRKVPTMTLVYGQSIDNLRGHVMDFFFTSNQTAALEGVLEDSGLSQADAIEFLHKGVVVKSIFYALDPDVVEFQNKMRSLTLFSELSGLQPNFISPTGSSIYIGEKATAGVEAKPQISFAEGDKTKKTTIPAYGTRVAPSSSRLIPSPVQGFDAATVIGVHIRP